MNSAEDTEDVLKTVNLALEKDRFGTPEKMALGILDEGMVGGLFRVHMKDPCDSNRDAAPSSFDVSLLHMAALRGQCLVIEWLLQQGVSIDQPDGKMRSPLFYAISANMSDAVELLARAGAKAYPTNNLLCNSDEDSAMMAFALRINNTDVFWTLFKWGEMDFNRYYRGRSLLTIAACNNDLILATYQVNELLYFTRTLWGYDFFNRHLARIDTDPIDQNTGRGLITEMVIRDYSELLDLFIGLGCDVNNTDNMGATALHYTVNAQCLDPLTQNPMKNTHVDDVWTARILLNNGAVKNIRDYAGHTVLFRAVQCNAFDVGELLIESDALTDIPDKGGITPICVAAANGRYEFVVKLLEAGANPFILSECNEFPSAFLHASASHDDKYRINGVADVLCLLYFTERYLIHLNMAAGNDVVTYPPQCKETHRMMCRQTGEFFHTQLLADKKFLMEVCMDAYGNLSNEEKNGLLE
jgi:ankyrin repeat protein